MAPVPWSHSRNFDAARNDPRGLDDLGCSMSKKPSRSRSLFILSLASPLVAAVVGLMSPSSACAEDKDCIEASCSGPKSCAKLKRACSYGGGSFVIKKRNQKGETTGGSCTICY